MGSHVKASPAQAQRSLLSLVGTELVGSKIIQFQRFPTFLFKQNLSSSRFELHLRYINTFLRNDLIVKRWVVSVPIFACSVNPHQQCNN